MRASSACIASCDCSTDAKSSGWMAGPTLGSEDIDVNDAWRAPKDCERPCKLDADAVWSPLAEWFCKEERELSDVDEEDAAALLNGNVRGLGGTPSAGVAEPRGLGEGEGRAEGGTAEGDGGRRSEIPSLCSEVKEGI